MSLFEEVNSAALPRLRGLLEEWFPAGRLCGSEFECGDLNGSPGKSFKVNVDTGKWADFAGDVKGGDVVSLFAAIRGLRQSEAVKELGRILGVEVASNGNHRATGTRSDEKPKEAWRPILPVPASAKCGDLSKAIFHGKSPIAVWEYRSELNELLGFVLRYDQEDKAIPMTFCENVEGLRGWQFVGFPEPRPLYGLARSAANPSAVVIGVEGEKCASNLQGILDVSGTTGYVAMTWPGGAKAPSKANWTPLVGKRVVVWPDHDEVGFRAAIEIAHRLESMQATRDGSISRDVQIVKPDPAWPVGHDVADLIAAGWDAARSLQYIEQNSVGVDAFAQIARERFGTTAEPASKESASEKSQATRLVKLAQGAGAELFHDGDDCFATVPSGDHVETFALRSRAMRGWLTHVFYDSEASAPNAEAVRGAIDTLAACASFEGEERRTFIRVASHAGKLYLDLANSRWRVVEIDVDGWRVLEAQFCPVRFRRAPGMRPLPTPERGGSVDELRPFVNLATDEDFGLVLGFLVACFRDRGPYPVLITHGPQGSAKSTLARVLRECVDPNTAPIRSEPREPRDLMIAANNGWVAVFDNLSRLPSRLSDALCRLSTGGGFATRTLYSDADETIFDAQRPIILTGIEELATRGDLLDRAIVQYLPRVTDDKMLPEAVFYARFYAARPRILGALLNAVACALANVDKVQLARLPRMADFATWVTAAEPALSMQPGAFLEAYTANRQAANQLTLEASSVAAALENLTLPIEDTATKVLAALNAVVDETIRRAKTWPQSGRVLSNALRRLAPNLAAVGIVVEFSRLNRSRKIRIERATQGFEQNTSANGGNSSSPSSPASFGDDESSGAISSSPSSSPKKPSKYAASDDGDDEIHPSPTGEFKEGFDAPDSWEVE